MNYVSGVDYKQSTGCNGQCVFTSFHPRTKESVVVARLDSAPDRIIWQKDFRALTYENGSRVFQLDWKVPAVPALLPSKERVSPPSSHPSPPQSQSLGKVWNAFLWDAFAPERHLDSRPTSLTFDAPAHRRIEAGDASGDTYEAFGNPVTWTNIETGEKKVLTVKPIDDGSNGMSHPLAISTADNFILIAEKFGGFDAIVADMNSGEVLLRAGDGSGFAGWGNCPAK